jgi:hypothetical protein
MPIVDELVTLLGAKEDPRAASVLTRWHGQIAVVLNSATQLGKTVYGAFEKMGRAIIGASDSALGLEQMSARTRLSTDAIQALGLAATEAGGSADEFYVDLEKMSMDAARQGISTAAWMQQIGQKFSKMNAQEAEFWRQYYGVSRSTFYMAKQLAGSLDEIIAHAKAMDAVIPDDLLTKAAETDIKFNSLSFVLKQMGERILIGLAPAITVVVDGIVKWLQVNKDWLALEIPKVFNEIVEAVKAVAKWITGEAIPAVTSFCKWLDDVGGKGTASTAALVALGLITFGPTIASFAALLLAINPVVAAVVALGAGLDYAANAFHDKYGYYSRELGWSKEHVPYNPRAYMTPAPTVLPNGDPIAPPSFYYLHGLANPHFTSVRVPTWPTSRPATSQPARSQPAPSQPAPIVLEIHDNTSRGVDVRYPGTQAAGAQ